MGSKLFHSVQDKMLVAITNGDVSMVQKLDDPSFDFGSFSPNGHTFFEWAVRGNHIGIVKYIYARESNADPKHTFHLIEDKNQHGDSPLMVAVMNKHIEMAMFLIGTANARVRARENSGGTIFIAACASGSLEMVYYLFDQPVNYYSKNNDGQTALHRACYFGELAVVRFLLKNTKLQLLAKDSHGNTCFHLAAKRLNLTLIRYMLKKFRKTQSVMAIPNSEGQTFIQILAGIFNLIRDEGFDFVSEKDVIDYVGNKQRPPEVAVWVRKLRDQKKKTYIGSTPFKKGGPHKRPDELSSFQRSNPRSRSRLAPLHSDHHSILQDVQMSSEN